jgi:hypothetical protein
MFDVFCGRLSLMLAEDDPEFPNWDQDEAAVKGRYDLNHPEDVEPELRQRAEAMATVLDGVTAGEWHRPGRRSNGSRFTVASLGRYMLHDTLHHLHDVSG